MVTTENTQMVSGDAEAERRLWTAVIKTAVEDWRFGTLKARREDRAACAPSFCESATASEWKAHIAIRSRRKLVAAWRA